MVDGVVDHPAAELVRRNLIAVAATRQDGDRVRAIASRLPLLGQCLDFGTDGRDRIAYVFRTSSNNQSRNAVSFRKLAQSGR